MNILASKLAELIRARVVEAIKGRTGHKLESRFIFHGPPIELLESVYEKLAGMGGVRIPIGDGQEFVLPVLLQLPRELATGPDPIIGGSGKCGENHLLKLRNDPNSPSFVALVPPGQHYIKSVSSTTEEFGINASGSSVQSTFEDWWEDGFVRQLVTEGLEDAGVGGLLDPARQVVEHAAAALDEVDKEDGSRRAAWRLLSRIYSIKEGGVELPPGSAVALACGAPPLQDGSISAKLQIGMLRHIAEGMSAGFRTGIERVKPNAKGETSDALDGFLAHIQARCDIPTAFERATEAFYLPSDALDLEAPPTWWTTLTVERWAELFAEETDEAGDLVIECRNAVIPVGRGMPAVVRREVSLSISIGAAATGEPTEVQLIGGSQGKVPVSLSVPGSLIHEDRDPPGHKAAITYKVTAVGRKAATARVISLKSWTPGVLVSCRVATKLSPPKKPSKRGGAGSPDWETSLTLPGSGRYELLILSSPGTQIALATGTADDATEVDEGSKELQVHDVRPDEYQVEIEADGKYQVDILYRREGQDQDETCRVYVACEEAREEGCRSEFERLIKLNRRHLEKIDTKTVVQLDRNARLSSLQSWALDDQNIARSFRPLVIAEDYASRWAPPDWDSPHGPILSHGRFLHDPRPAPALFQAPTKFVEARQEIARRIRGTDDQAGLLESAPLGAWLSRDPDFKPLVESYLDAYMEWLSADREVASWVDIIAVTSLEADGRTLARVPDAIVVSPLHPLRLAWHCLAQNVLFEEAEGEDARPCPAASILDPDCVPDLMTLPLQSPGGTDQIDFISVECNSDYWSVLWNGSRLDRLLERTRKAPFDLAFGLTVGGISSGFSPAQVARALEDVTDLLAAKPTISLVVDSAGGASDACSEGLSAWCMRRFGNDERTRQGMGPRILEVFDIRRSGSRPDEATIANLSESTANHVRWFDKQPIGAKPDLGIVAQLDSAQPEATNVGLRSPMSEGGLIRHRVRRQLHGAFLSESRQGLKMPPGSDVFSNKVAACMLALECANDSKVGLRFAPNVHAIGNLLEEKHAGFVAVSSTAIDPACFLGDWIKGAYLWDYDLPAYSHRAGDTSGYYLLSQIKEADREALKRVLNTLPGCDALDEPRIADILLEVARRGIPTVRGLSGDDTGATGNLGLFVAVRLLQDKFRLTENCESLLPLLAGSADDASIAIIVPIDPFRGYLADLAISLGKERKDASLSRPDLLVVGIHAGSNGVRIRLTPVEVKCRQGSTLGPADIADALSQARSLSVLLHAIDERAQKSTAWRLAYKHLLLSIIGFGLRVYSQRHAAAGQSALWANYHERIAEAILSPDPDIAIDERGRLVVVDGSGQSEAYDRDGDGFCETIVVSSKDAGRIVAGDAQAFYDAVRMKADTWQLLPLAAKNRDGAETIVARPPSAGGGGSNSSEEKIPVCAPAGSGEALMPTRETGAPEGRPAEVQNPEMAQGSDGNAEGIKLSVGRTVDGFEPRPLSLNISDTRLNQLNIGVVGDLGTGKTQFLKALILQITKATKENRGIKPRFLIFDYKRDYSSPDFVEATGARVVKPTRLPLNLFDTSSMGDSAAPWLDRFRFFADVLDKVYSGIGPVQRDKLKGAVRSAYESCRGQGRPPTIYDIHREYRQLLGGKSDSPMSIIDDLVDMEVFTSESGDAKPFDQFLDGVVVISLDALGQDDRSKNMLVAIMLNMFYENMLKTPKRPFQGTDPQLRVIDSYLLVDEADNIMRYEFDVLRKLLLQGREFGAGVILASQYLRHFKVNATDYREPLLTWFIHKVPNVTPAELGALGFTADLGELVDRVKTLPNHHCLYKSFDIAGEAIRGLPFYELVENLKGTPGN